MRRIALLALLAVGLQHADAFVVCLQSPVWSQGSIPVRAEREQVQNLCRAHPFLLPPHPHVGQCAL